ncbi:anhydro-N-acetylmuramic acid kinase [Pseudoalteromonas sp. SSDWG2]|uniref:anhydro-N-acetylmuramic acid kinase n=1 Tax=Pseudoalteromonas sp. SSDWG2 TaxID=3139391 RepID=UPI003BAD1002
MHPHIENLVRLADKPTRTIIGLMSGTSMDGLDVALCDVTGFGSNTAITVRHFKTCAYPKGYQQRVREVFAKRQVDLQHLTVLNPWIGKLHGQLVNECLAQWQVSAEDIDVIASHGQTVFHCPQKQHQLPDYPNATLQIGDGCHVAVTTGILTVSDFRQKHVAAGGEGAPLAAYGDYLYFSSEHENRVLLNLGGIANITYLGKGAAMGDTVCADIGPSNTMLDAYVQHYFAPKYFDKDSELAMQGSVSRALLKALLAHPYLAHPMPKTTGPEVFNLDFLRACQTQSSTLALQHVDVLATLTEFCACSVAEQLNSLALEHGNVSVYASGGGLHNPLLMARINERLSADVKVYSLGNLGIDPDAKEAVLFALLANETLAGRPISMSHNSAMPNVSMGKISFPD